MFSPFCEGFISQKFLNLQYLHIQKIIFILFYMFLCIKVRKVKERKKKKRKKDLGQKEQWMKLLPHSEVSQDLDSKYGDMGRSRVGAGDLTPPPPGKSQVAIGFLRNSGLNHPREAIGGP